MTVLFWICAIFAVALTAYASLHKPGRLAQVAAVAAITVAVFIATRNMNHLQTALTIVVALYLALRVVFPYPSRVAGAYFRYGALSLCAALFLCPFYWLVSGAVKDSSVLMTYTFLPPIAEWSRETINLDNVIALFRPRLAADGPVYFWEHILNSLFYASVVTVIQLFFCSLGGYALAKYRFRGKKTLIVFMLGSMMIPGILFLAPMYRMMVALDWVDTYYALIVPAAVTPFGMFLFRQAMIGIPNDLIEAGRIDGCSEFRVYFALIMPLVRPMSSAFCLITFMATWNNYLWPQVFLHSERKTPLPIILSQYVGVYDQQYGVFLAGTLIAIIPPAILFFALQREFIAGLTSGAVKG